MLLEEGKVSIIAKRWLVALFVLLVVAVMIGFARAVPEGAPVIAESVPPIVGEELLSSAAEAEVALQEAEAEAGAEVAEAVAEAAATAGTLGKLKEDLGNFDLGNTDARRVSLANYFAGYDGQFVFFGNWANRRSGSFGRLMGLYGNDKYYPEILKHEHGHYEQYKQLGLLKYLFAIALPSIKNDPARDYYSQLWEVTADILGGVTTHTHTPDAEEAGMRYLEFVKENNLLVSIIFGLVF